MAKYIHISWNLELGLGDLLDNTEWDSSWYFSRKYACQTDTFLEQSIDKNLAPLNQIFNLLSIPNSNEILSGLKSALIDGKNKSELLKEITFENARNNLYPHCPTRYKCLFFSSADMTVEQICKKYGFVRSDKRAIYMLEDADRSNVSFSADPDYLNCNMSSPHEILEQAKKYWSGEEMSPSSIKEILALGKFRVVEKLPWPLL